MPVTALRRSAWMVVGLSTLGASPVEAQVTAEDVWASNEVYWEAFGLDLDGSPMRDGSVVTVTGITATAAFPLGTGTLAAMLPDLVLTELGGRTAQKALRDGAEPREVWIALCRANDVPEGRWHGIDPAKRRH